MTADILHWISQCLQTFTSIERLTVHIVPFGLASRRNPTRDITMELVNLIHSHLGVNQNILLVTTNSGDRWGWKEGKGKILRCKE